MIGELRRGLAQLGLTDVPDRTVVKALVEAYPDGHREVDAPELLSVLFGHINRQDPSDNVAR